MQILLGAIEASGGVRALLSIGWANLGADFADRDRLPPNVFLLGNVPHDWLFPRCKAVVHHGGAGTTAIGVMVGRPTFVGEFWGGEEGGEGSADYLGWRLQFLSLVWLAVVWFQVILLTPWFLVQATNRSGAR